MARAGNVFFLLAASKMNVEKYIFPHCTRTDRMCPNLNCGMFEVKRMHPIRSIPDFQQYWKSRFDEDISIEEAQEYFHKTGGVGRYILLCKQGNTEFSPADVDIFQSDPQLFHMACSLLEAPISNALLSKYASPDKVDEWIDRLLFYMGPEHITFLLDSVKDRFKQHIGTKKLLEQAHIFHTQRKGFKGGSSGHSNEDFIYRFLPSLYDLNPHEKSLKLIISNEVFHLSTLDSTEVIYVPPLTNKEEIDSFLKQYERCFIQWQVDGSETGIDRIWYHWDNNGNNTLILHGVQVKTGNDNHSITCGNLQSERAHATASRFNDRSIAGIYSKAERGLIALVPLLRKRFGCNVALGTMHVCTNKKAQKGFDEFFREEMKTTNHYYKIPSAVCKKHGIESQFACSLIDGTDWLEEIIPDSLYPFI